MNNALIPLAFSAGLITFLNPCGFALLPVYIAYYFKNEGLENKSASKKVFYGILFGLVVSLGFIFAFSIIGMAVSFIGKGIVKYLVYFDFAIGLVLASIGAMFLFGLERGFGFSKITNFGEKLKSNNSKNKYLSFFIYGIGFAVASIGCTLPIFLIIVTSAVNTSGLLDGIYVFLSYSLGMSFFMIAFSLAVALSKTAIEKTLKRWLPYVYKLGALIVLAAGLYLIYNQIFILKIFGIS